MIARRELVFLALTVLVGLALRLDWFTGLIGSDELTHAYAAHDFLGDPSDSNVDVSGAFSINVRRIGVNFPLWISTSIFGVHEWSLALVPMVFSLAGILIAYATLRMLASSTAGLIAAAMWACLPVDVYHASLWLSDNLFATVLMLGICLLVASEKDPRRRHLYALGAGLAFGYLEYLKETAIGVLGPVGLWLLLASWRARKIDKRSESDGVGALPALPVGRGRSPLGIDWRIGWLLGGFVAVQALASIYFWAVFGDPFHFWTVGFGRYAEVMGTDDEVKHSIPACFGMLKRYALDQGILGHTAVLFPALFVAAMLDRRTALRGVLALLLALQLVIVIKVLTYANWTQPPLSAQGAERYHLQIAPLFIIFTVLGIHALLARVPRAWPEWLRDRVPLAAGATAVLLTGFALNPVHQSYDRAGAAVLRDTHVYLDAVVASGDIVYVDAGHVTDAHDRLLPSYTLRSLELLHGYRPWKGQFRPLEEATGATRGWVVLTHFEHRRRKFRGDDDVLADLPPNWLEVFRAERLRGRFFARVFKILAEPVPAGVVVLRDPARAAALDLTALTFAPIALDEPGDSRWATGAGRAITPLPDGVELTVNPTGDAGARHVGALSFAVDGLSALRGQLELIAPEHVHGVFVYLTDGGKQVVKWSWTLTDLQRQQGFAGPLVLVPDQPTGQFRRGDGVIDPADVREVHVLLRVSGGAAGLRLRGVEVAR